MYVSACIYALGFRAKGGRTTEIRFARGNLASEAKIRAGEINESWRNGKGMKIGLGRKAKGERRKAKCERRKAKRATWDKSGDQRARQRRSPGQRNKRRHVETE